MLNNFTENSFYISLCFRFTYLKAAGVPRHFIGAQNKINLLDLILICQIYLKIHEAINQKRGEGF